MFLILFLFFTTLKMNMYILLLIVRIGKVLRMLSMRKKITSFTEEVLWEEGFCWDLASVVCV